MPNVTNEKLREIADLADEGWYLTDEYDLEVRFENIKKKALALVDEKWEIVAIATPENSQRATGRTEVIATKYDSFDDALDYAKTQSKACMAHGAQMWGYYVRKVKEA